METIRKPLQGVSNILRFNWHFYLIAALFICFGIFIIQFVPDSFKIVVKIGLCFIVFTTFISLFVSYYIYDYSDIYQLNWIESSDENITIANINAGFDETSDILKSKFKNAEFKILDFYNPEKHTEISIERARKKYPPNPDSVLISTTSINLENNSIDKVFLIFAAHEIRNYNERLAFFNELNRILKPNGEIYIIEHLRDFANSFSYTFGVFHFFSKNSWLKIIHSTNFKIQKIEKITPFITSFKIQKNGITS